MCTNKTFKHGLMLTRFIIFECKLSNLLFTLAVDRLTNNCCTMSKPYHIFCIFFLAHLLYRHGPSFLNEQSSIEFCYIPIPHYLTAKQLQRDTMFIEQF